MCPEIVSDKFLLGNGNHYKPKQQNDFFSSSKRTVVIIVKA